MKYRIVHSQDVFDVMRFDGSYHNADANIYDAVIKKHSSHNLSYYCSEIFASGRNKRVYTRPEFGYPFLSNSDVVSSNPFMSCKYSSKKYGFDETAVLKAGMIVTGRVGAIGQTAFIPAYLEKAKAMGSDNIIRISVKSSEKNGYIYAYLASKLGNLSVWKHATGGVQPFITDAMVASIPIPSFPEDFQNKINDLVLESARLREEAADVLEKAIALLSGFIGDSFMLTDKKHVGKVSLKSITSTLNLRFDPPVYINKGVSTVQKLSCKTIPLGECNARFWYPGIFKRTYVKDGLPYIKGSSLFEVNPFIRCDFLSRSRTPGLKELWLKEGQILMSCAGICGQVKLITKEYEDKKAIGSPDIIRIQPMDSLYTKEYLFTYLQLPFVYDYMQSLKYGSVIERFDIDTIKTIPVVTPTKELSEEITEIIKRYSDCTYRAFNAEEKAIRMVEQEIEKWNK